MEAKAYTALHKKIIENADDDFDLWAYKYSANRFLNLGKD